jgi:hypothetical protein
MNKNHIRLLVTLILTAAFASGVVGNALASRWMPLAKSPVTVNSLSIAKPTARPANGEPDGGQTIAPPASSTTRGIQPLGGWTSGVGGRSRTEWTQWIWASWITRYAR